MKCKLLYVVLGILVQLQLHAQICPDDTSGIRNLVLPVITNLEGYHGPLHLFLPGTNVTDKADAFVDALLDEYANKLGDKEISRTGAYVSPSSSLVEYHQHSNGVKIKGHRILLSMDSEDQLRSFDIYLVLGTADLDTIEDLTDTVTVPANFTIQKVNGSWALQANYQPQEPQLACEDNGNYKLWVNFPNHTCCQTSDGIPAGHEQLAYLKTGTDQDPMLCGEYANLDPNKSSEAPANGFGSFQDNCTENGIYTGNIRPLYETTMCYYHLNAAFDYIDHTLSGIAASVGLDPFEFRKDILFDPFSSPGGTNVFVDYLSNPPKILLKGISDGSSDCPTDFFDYSEDADFILETAFELMLHEEFVYPKYGSKEGLGNGTVAFLTWDFMASNGHSHNLIGNYAGRKLVAPFEIPIDVTVENNYNYVLDPNNIRVRENASVWAATLKEIIEIFKIHSNEDAFRPLLFKSMRSWDDESNQFEAAYYLYNEIEMMYRMPSSLISKEQFCAIQEVFKRRYANYDNDIFDGIEFHFITDYLVKDTYLSQSGNPTPEDIGNEPNFESAYYDYSPAIWNCHTQNCTNNELPTIPGDNYIHVAVVNHNHGCDWTGNIEVYANMSSTLDDWPRQWGGDINHDNVPDDYHINYYGYNLLVAKRIANIDLATGDFTEDGDKRIYNAHWDPWNPDPWNKTKYFRNKVQQGYLARIKSNVDPLHEEVEGNSLSVVRDYNSFAQRKQGILIYEPNPDDVVTPVLFSIPFTSPNTPVQLRSSFTYLNAPIPENNFDTIGTIKLLFPKELVDGFDAEQPVGSGFQWLNDSMIVLTSPDFKISLAMDTGVTYPIMVIYRAPSAGYIPFSFNLQQFSEEDCYEGGQYFVVSQNGITPRSEQHEITRHLNAFPNPVDDLMTIQYNGGEFIRAIKVFDVMGRLMYSSDVLQEKCSFSTLSWPEGYYIARTLNANGESHSVSFVHSQKR